MTTAALTPFTQEFLSSWRLFYGRWVTVIALALVPLLPLALLSPYFLERAQPSVVSVSLALIAIVLFYLVSILSRATIFIAYTEQVVPTFRSALRRGLRRYLAYAVTEVLAVLVVAVALIPLMTFNLGDPFGVLAGTPQPLARAATFAATLLLVAPAAVLAVLLAFAPLTAAVGQGTGLSALRRSATLLWKRGVFWAVFKRLALWILLFVVVCTAVEPLPFAAFLVPFVMSLIGAAFLVTVYRELGGQLKPAE